MRKSADGGRRVETFGDALKRLRMAAHLSQSDLAKAAAWSQSQVSRAEGNRFTPDEATVARLDLLLQAQGSLIKAHTMGSAGTNGKTADVNTPWAISDIVRQIHRTDIEHRHIIGPENSGRHANIRCYGSRHKMSRRGDPVRRRRILRLLIERSQVRILPSRLIGA